MPESLARRPDGAVPTEQRVALSEVAVTYYDWPGPGRTLILAHATGFHGRIWDEVVRWLPEFRILALDLRGHGRTAAPGPPASWEIFGDDVVEFVRALDLSDALGVGHSMGGHSLTIAAAREPGAFGGLLLVDPVMPLEARPPREGRGGASDFVRKRRNEWPNPEEMVERFRDRFPYSGWQPQVLDDYARYGLLPAPGGDGYRLACAPDFEADTYGASGQGPAMGTEVIPQVGVPVTVMRGRQPVPGEQAPPFATSPTPPHLASLFAAGHDVLLPERSHFIPMEDPQAVADEVRSLDDRIGASVER